MKYLGFVYEHKQSQGFIHSHRLNERNKENDTNRIYTLKNRMNVKASLPPQPSSLLLYYMAHDCKWEVGRERTCTGRCLASAFYTNWVVTGQQRGDAD